MSEPSHLEPSTDHEPHSGSETQVARDRVAWRAIWAATVVGAVWRVAMLVAKWSQGLLFNDSLYYSFQAVENSHGNWFQEVFTNGPGAQHPPLASLVMTPASLLGHAVFWQRATNTVIGIVLVPLVALLALRVAGRRVAVVTALLAAVYPNLWINDSLVMSESLSALLVVVVLLCAWQLRHKIDHRMAAIAGVFIGLAALTRSELLLLAPLVALIGCRTRGRVVWLKHAAIVVGAALATIMPWTILNFSRFEKPVLISTNDGGALLGSNCDETYARPGLGGFRISCFDFSGSVPGEDASQLSQRQRTLALRYMRDHIERVPVVVVARLLRSADLYGLDDLILFDVGDERARWASWSGIVSWWLLAPIATLGWWRRRRSGGYILLMPVIGVVVTGAMFYGAHRLRAPMEPVVVVCAAMGLVSTKVGRRVLDALCDGVLVRAMRTAEKSP